MPRHAAEKEATTEPVNFLQEARSRLKKTPAQSKVTEQAPSTPNECRYPLRSRAVQMLTKQTDEENLKKRGVVENLQKAAPKPAHPAKKATVEEKPATKARVAAENANETPKPQQITRAQGKPGSEMPGGSVPRSANKSKKDEGKGSLKESQETPQKSATDDELPIASRLRPTPSRVAALKAQLLNPKETPKTDAQRCDENPKKTGKKAGAAEAKGDLQNEGRVVTKENPTTRDVPMLRVDAPASASNALEEPKILTNKAEIPKEMNVKNLASMFGSLIVSDGAHSEAKFAKTKTQRHMGDSEGMDDALNLDVTQETTSPSNVTEKDSDHVGDSYSLDVTSLMSSPDDETQQAETLAMKTAVEDSVHSMVEGVKGRETQDVLAKFASSSVTFTESEDATRYGTGQLRLVGIRRKLQFRRAPRTPPTSEEELVELEKQVQKIFEEHGLSERQSIPPEFFLTQSSPMSATLNDSVNLPMLRKSLADKGLLSSPPRTEEGSPSALTIPPEYFETASSPISSPLSHSIGLPILRSTLIEKGFSLSSLQSTEDSNSVTVEPRSREFQMVGDYPSSLGENATFGAPTNGHSTMGTAYGSLQTDSLVTGKIVSKHFTPMCASTPRRHNAPMQSSAPFTSRRPATGDRKFLTPLDTPKALRNMFTPALGSTPRTNYTSGQPSSTKKGEYIESASKACVLNAIRPAETLSNDEPKTVKREQNDAACTTPSQTVTVTGALKSQGSYGKFVPRMASTPRNSRGPNEPLLTGFNQRASKGRPAAEVTNASELPVSSMPEKVNEGLRIDLFDVKAPQKTVPQAMESAIEEVQKSDD